MKKVIGSVLMILGFCLVIVGLVYKVPSSHIRTHVVFFDDNYEVEFRNDYSDVPEYVGGDAYNYQIGASIVGPQIAAAKTNKTIYIVGGCLIFSLGLLALAMNRTENGKNNSSSSTTVVVDEKVSNILDSPLLKATQPKKANWICPKCNASNPSYVGTCSCGFCKE